MMHYVYYMFLSTRPMCIKSRICVVCTITDLSGLDYFFRGDIMLFACCFPIIT